MLDTSISIHAPTNGATLDYKRDERTFNISIHAPTNGATIMELSLRTIQAYFNPRSDERSDSPCKVSFDIVDKFQSTLRRTERLHDNRLPQQGVHFNPRSDERSDYVKLTASGYERISIHAPTNGATQTRHKSTKNFPISIHAPTNGATPHIGESKSYLNISIHAPTNGAT